MRENNKEKLFAQTFSLLLTRNIGDLTLDEVEKATGFTRGAIFYYSSSARYWKSRTSTAK